MSYEQFALGTYDAGEGPFPAVVLADQAHDLRPLLAYDSVAAVLDDWDTALPRLVDLVERCGLGEGLPIAQLRTLPPVGRRSTIFAAGANYREHVMQLAVAHRMGKAGASEEELAAAAAREIDERRANGSPYVWVGASSGISGAYDDVILPSGYDDHDWELELGVIIGRPVRRVSVDDALSYVAGYTICNDITTRSLVGRLDIPMMGTDWLRAKNSPTFFPTGPWLVPAMFVPDPMKLGIRLRLNGQTMQDSTTSDMVFGIAELIAYISQWAEMQPGDMLITGSPAGNGSHYGRFLRDGDVMECEIDGLGVQRTRCVAESR
jgi:2-keto-4-pentenoate hydratase/2-oxohepta-3-ene-1,7-dioic acid hydratase in catechol pathway